MNSKKCTFVHNGINENNIEGGAQSADKKINIQEQYQPFLLKPNWLFQDKWHKSLNTDSKIITYITYYKT